MIPDGTARDDDPATPPSGAALVGLHLHRAGRHRLVLAVTGELDRLAAPALVAFLGGRLVGEPPGTEVAIDLTATTFVDLGGLDALLEVRRRAADRGIGVYVGRCRPEFLRLLRVTAAVGLLVPPLAGPSRACRSSGGRRPPR